jgi:hypothetical protein
MNARMVCLVSAFALLPLAHAAENKEDGRYLAKPLKGDYYVYGGSIGDKTAPTSRDRKVSLMVTGPLAQDLFDHIGPDAKDSCSPALITGSGIEATLPVPGPRIMGIRAISASTRGPGKACMGQPVDTFP